MQDAREVVPEHADVDGRLDAATPEGRELLAQEVARQAGVHGPDIRGVVGVAVVALGEHVDGRDVRIGKARREGISIEARGDRIDAARRVEIQVDLSVPEIGHA